MMGVMCSTPVEFGVSIIFSVGCPFPVGKLRAEFYNITI